MPRGKRTRARMALAACVLWLAGFEVFPWLHVVTHEHIGAHHHDASGAIIRDGETDDDHDADTDEHAHGVATHDHDDEDAEVDEHGRHIAHHHADHDHDADQHHDAPLDGERRLRSALGHGRHSLAHHDVSTTAPPPVLTTPLPIERRPTFVLVDTAIEPYSFSPGRAVARGPPTI